MSSPPQQQQQLPNNDAATLEEEQYDDDSGPSSPIKAKDDVVEAMVPMARESTKYGIEHMYNTNSLDTIEETTPAAPVIISKPTPIVNNTVSYGPQHHFATQPTVIAPLTTTPIAPTQPAQPAIVSNNTITADIDLKQLNTVSYGPQHMYDNNSGLVGIIDVADIEVPSLASSSEKRSTIVKNYTTQLLQPLQGNNNNKATIDKVLEIMQLVEEVNVAEGNGNTEHAKMYREKLEKQYNAQLVKRVREVPSEYFGEVKQAVVAQIKGESSAKDKGSSSGCLVA